MVQYAKAFLLGHHFLESIVGTQQMPLKNTLRKQTSTIDTNSQKKNKNQFPTHHTSYYFVSHKNILIL
jgi:hypothetical protein